MDIRNILYIPDMPGIKIYYKDKKASVHWSAAENNDRIPAIKLVVNWKLCFSSEFA